MDDFRNTATALNGREPWHDFSQAEESAVSSYSLLQRKKIVRPSQPVDDSRVITPTLMKLEISFPKNDNLAMLPDVLSQNQQRLKEAKFSLLLSTKIERLAYKTSPDCSSLSTKSLQNFLTFWNLAKKLDPKIVEPDVFLCPNGNLQAEWYKNSKRQLAIEFGNEFSLCVCMNGEKVFSSKDGINGLASTLSVHTDHPLRWQ